jgi:hypothetical protein
MQGGSDMAVVAIQIKRKKEKGIARYSPGKSD